MVELRKRKTPPVVEPKPARKKSSTTLKTKAKDAISAVTGKPADTADTVNPQDDPGADPAAPESKGPATPGKAPEVGQRIDLAEFGGEIQTHEGRKVTLADLVTEGGEGVVIFTYPKQNTPGCTKQACLFRDAHAPLTATSLTIYGLSPDPPTGNTSFRTKHSLPYTLLCDPSHALLKPLGLAKPPKSAKRGVFVVDKTGTVLALEEGGPQATVDVVKRVVDGMGGQKSDGLTADKGGEADTAAGAREGKAVDVKMADTADEVADTAAGLDGTPKPA